MSHATATALPKPAARPLLRHCSVERTLRILADARSFLVLREIYLGARRFEQIGDVRGDGLFIALEFVTDRSSQTPNAVLASRVVNAMRRRHVLISASGLHGNTLKIRPPLPFGIPHAELVIEALAASLDES